MLFSLNFLHEYFNILPSCNSVYLKKQTKKELTDGWNRSNFKSKK